MRKLAAMCIASVLFCRLVVFSQDAGKQVTFEAGSQIKVVTATSKYVAALVRSATSDQNAFLFDKSGNKLMEIRSEADFQIFQMAVSEPHSLFIVIGALFKDASRENGAVQIRAVNISTGRLAWTAWGSPCRYGISPDGMSLLPLNEPLEGALHSPPGFHIVNLRDGSVSRPISLSAWHAAWLDSNTIVLATRDFQPTVPSLMDMESIQVSHVVDSLLQELVHRDNMFRLGKIPRLQYDADVVGLKAMIDSSKAKRSRLEARIRASGQSRFVSTTVLRVLERATGRIEIEKHIETADGIPIQVKSGFNPPIGTLIVDQPTGDIYINGFLPDQRTQEGILVKFSRSLEKQFELRLVESYLLKVVAEGEVHFAVFSSRGVSVVDQKNGQLIYDTTIHTRLGEVDPKTLPKGQPKDILSGVIVGSSNNAIMFKPIPGVER